MPVCPQLACRDLGEQVVVYQRPVYQVPVYQFAKPLIRQANSAHFALDPRRREHQIEGREGRPSSDPVG
jgi:hypothetical protein